MRILTEEQYQKEAEPMLRKIFAHDDPFEDVFVPNITARKLLYRFSCELSPALAGILVAAASNLGDQGLYWTLLWRNQNQSKQTDKINHYYIPFSEFFPTYYIHPKEELYKTIGNFFIQENVMYSPQGKWGIIFSHEDYCLLGGVTEFVEYFERLLPEIDEQVYDFIDYFLDFKFRNPKIVTIAWIPKLLTHIYGKEKADKMLKERGAKYRKLHKLFKPLPKKYR